MSRDFLVNGLVALFAAVVMVLGIKLAAADESATAGTPTQSEEVIGCPPKRDGRP